MPARSLYLVLDMINDLVHEQGPNGSTPLGEQVRSRGLLANTRVALEKARKAGVPVGYVRVGFSPDYRECPPASPIFSRAREHGLFKLGNWGTEVHPELAPSEADFDIVKHRVSPFYGTKLEVILRTLGAERIVASGISTTGVVHSCAREGHDRDYEIVVLEDCCCALDDAQHQAVIEGMSRMATITTSGTFDFES